LYLIGHNLTIGEIIMFGLGWPEVAIIAIAAIVIFGPKKIPELGSALGKTLRGFKEEINNPQENSANDEREDI
jgi:sec-independent protein translocase protein TatA